MVGIKESPSDHRGDPDVTLLGTLSVCTFVRIQSCTPHVMFRSSTRLYFKIINTKTSTLSKNVIYTQSKESVYDRLTKI